MGTNLIIKALLQKTEQGNFKNVYETIQNKQIDPASALKIIISCCTVCNNNLSKPGNVDEENLSKLLKYLVKFIHNPTEKVLETYLRSIHFILKLLLEKKSFTVIIELEDVCIPNFIPNILTDKHISLYQSTCSLMFNSLVGLSHTKTTKYDQQELLKICYLLSSMYNRFLNQTNLIEKTYKCTICLSALQVPVIQQTNYYLHLMGLLNKSVNNLKKNQDQDVSYKLLLDFFSYVMINLIKQNEFEKAIECTEKTIEKCGKLFDKNLNSLLDICLWLNPKYTKKTKLVTVSHNKLKTFYKQNGLTTNLETVCSLITTITTAFVQSYKNSLNQLWNNTKTITEQLNFYKLLFDISQLFTGMPLKSGCCCGCNTKTNLIDSVRIIISITRLSYLFVIENPTIPNIYLTELLKYFKKACNQIATLKDCNCQNWKKVWADIAVHLYNISFSLYKTNDLNATTYLTLFLKNIIKLEGTKPIVISEQTLNSALTVLGEINFKSNNFKEALEICAFNIAIFPKHRELEIVRWIRYKAISREHDLFENAEIQESTVVSVLDNQLIISEFIQNFKLDETQQIELLVFELENYKIKWKSKLPMFSTYEHLTRIAKPSQLAQVFVGIWGQCDLSVHEKLPKLLETTLKLVESSSDSNEKISKLNLAHLYYLHYKFSSKNAIIKNCEVMEKTINTLKSTTDVKNIEVVDREDECDIISSYEALKLDNCNKIIQYIEKSVSILSNMIRNDSTFSALNLETHRKVYNLLKLIGYEFRLQLNTAFSLQVWELALNVAKLIQDNLLIVESIGFIVELADLNKFDTKQLIESADEIVEELLKDKKINSQVLITYLVCKIKVYFLHDFQIAYKSFESALELLEFVEDEMEVKFLTAVLDCLHCKFLQLPCKFNVEGHDSVIKVYTAYRSIVNQYTANKSNCSYKMSYLFEINEELIKMYHEKRMIREVRCYAKAMVLIAQSMILPIRTALFLKTLAYADLIGCRLDDCKVKLNGLNDILCLKKRKHTTPRNNPQVIESKTETNQIVDNLTYEFNEMMLDLPSTKTFYHQTSPSSPSLVVEKFKLPSLFDHSNSCSCFYCISLEYQKCILWKAYLDALVNERQDREIARLFFIGSLKMYELFKRKQESYEKKIQTMLTFNVLSDYMDNFLEVYCHVLLDFANYMMRSNNRVDAENMNKKLFSCIYPRKSEFVYLYNAVLVQRICILEKSTENKKCLGSLAVEACVGAKSPFRTPPPSGNRPTNIRPLRTRKNLIF